MSTFCGNCKREVVVGVTENSGIKLWFDAWSEPRYWFPSPDRQEVRLITTWRLHRCIPGSTAVVIPFK